MKIEAQWKGYRLYSMSKTRNKRRYILIYISYSPLNYEVYKTAIVHMSCRVWKGKAKTKGTGGCTSTFQGFICYDIVQNSESVRKIENIRVMCTVHKHNSNTNDVALWNVLTFI